MDWWLPHHLYPIKLKNHASHRDSIIIAISFSPCIAFALHLLFLQCCIQIVIANMAHGTLYAFALNLLFLFTLWTQKRFPLSFHSQYNFPSFIAAPMRPEKMPNYNVHLLINHLVIIMQWCKLMLFRHVWTSKQCNHPPVSPSSLHLH